MFSLDEIIFEEEAHTYEYRKKRYDSVTGIIRDAGLGPDFSMVSPERMEFAQDRGKKVHLATQYFDEGRLNLNTIDPRIQGYVEAYIRFRREKKIKVIAVEKRFVCPSLLFAGTPDLICWMDGYRSVIDKKTSQVLCKSMGLQTFGYFKGWNHNHPTQQLARRYGLRLEKTGYYKLIEHNDPDDGPAFNDAQRHAQSLIRMAPWKVKYGHH